MGLGRLPEPLARPLWRLMGRLSVLAYAGPSCRSAGSSGVEGDRPSFDRGRPSKPLAKVIFVIVIRFVFWSPPNELRSCVCVGVIELIATRVRETRPCRSVAALVATLHEERRSEGGAHQGHGLELAGRQELFGGHDRRVPRVRGGQPNRSDHRQRAPDGVTLLAREEHARLVAQK